MQEEFRTLLPLLRRCSKQNTALSLKAHEIVALTEGIANCWNSWGYADRAKDTAISDVLSVIHWPHQKARVKKICADLIAWIEAGCPDMSA